MFIRANARRKKHTECITEYSCDVLGLVAFESCRRRGAYLLWNITVLKMFENINYYNARGEWTVQMQRRTVRYYCCEYLQEIYTDRTACMPQNLQASQFSWCKHQDVMQTCCSHDVRATGRHLRLDMMTHRDSFPILHNFYRLRYIMVSFRANPSTPKNCITEDSCILQYLRLLRSERADVAGSTDCGTVPTLMCRYFYPGEYKVKSYSRTNFPHITMPQQT